MSLVSPRKFAFVCPFSIFGDTFCNVERRSNGHHQHEFQVVRRVWSSRVIAFRTSCRDKAHPVASLELRIFVKPQVKRNFFCRTMLQIDNHSRRNLRPPTFFALNKTPSRSATKRIVELPEIRIAPFCILRASYFREAASKTRFFFPQNAPN